VNTDIRNNKGCDIKKNLLKVIKKKINKERKVLRTLAIYKNGHIIVKKVCCYFRETKKIYIFFVEILIQF